MIVSIAIVVFPVCLSHIINSLCHLPIGTIESIALIQVSIGMLTDCLVITHGATFSMGYMSLVWISHLPSIGLARASTTLHKNFSQTFIEKTLPVDLMSCQLLSHCHFHNMSIHT